MNDRRKSDRRMPPSVAQHAIEEREELLAAIADRDETIARLLSEIDDIRNRQNE